MNGNAFVESLGWVLIHSLWQFALIALIAGAAKFGLRRRSAKQSHFVHSAQDRSSRFGCRNVRRFARRLLRTRVA